MRAAFILLGCVVACSAETQYQRQIITVPVGTAPGAGAVQWRFTDVDGEGRTALLALSRLENKLWIYRQKAGAFSSNADQVITLPPGFSWIASGEVEPGVRPALLISTRTGISYLRQTNGLFETEPRMLVPAEQPFSGETTPVFVFLPGQKERTNIALPVISAEQAVLYQRAGSSGWQAATRLPLGLAHTSWNSEQDNWALDTAPAHSLNVTEQFRSGPPAKDEDKPENEAIRKIVEERPERLLATEIERADLNHDGREDLVVMRVSGAFDFKTDLFIFFRGPDHKLPERPGEILHCSGFPVGVGERRRWSCVCDLDGDGTCELVLAAARTVIASSSGVVEMVLTKGVDFAINIRSLHHGTYSKSPDTWVDVTSAIAPDLDARELFVLDGDFNGDHRKDLVVRRNTEEWDVYFSTAGGTWFLEKPRLKFESPMDGYLDIEDMNGDGLSDLAIESWEKPAIALFLSRRAGAR
jgi:hypothetical protein